MIYIYIALGIAVLVITILALIGLKVKKKEREIRKQLGVEDTTSPEELEKAIKRFKRKQFMTHKQVRDEWLKSKGYIYREAYMKIPIKPTGISIHKDKSGFQKALIQFRNVKIKHSIQIYSALKNKYGIPYYEIKKTLGEQIRGI